MRERGKERKGERDKERERIKKRDREGDMSVSRRQSIRRTPSAKK
jgi:hypothetical protein